MPANRSTQSLAARPRRNRGALPAGGPEEFAVVGIGASAGGLDACRKLFGAIAAGNGMAYILVLHLDPTHESMMVDLLSSHTSMPVKQATDGMPIECGHVYVIPPGAYLSVNNGALHLSEPQARHGARLPFDFLLQSLAVEYGERAICVILSGTGADGSLGLRAVKERRGFIIAQNAGEAAYDGMPRSAVMTGAVDVVLPVAEIPDALVKRGQEIALRTARQGSNPRAIRHEWLTGIVELLRTKTRHDFTLYKRGTLLRRIERRMGMAGINTDEVDRYLEIVRGDAHELDLLAKDLLINVTSFFRDPKVFDFVSKNIIADLIRAHTADRPIRVWIAGCSTGEEAYSLVMLFREQIAAAKSNVKLQVFATDADADAVAIAREGLYPDTIESDVSAERLARFFTKEDHSYRVTTELRGAVVFTVQDVLCDPPFSRLDLISCRNLLIYLSPEAQAKVISLFHFALCENGVLLLGSSETAGDVTGRFELISKPVRLYRHIGRARPGDLGFVMGSGNVRTASGREPEHTASRPADLAELCRRLVLETHAPAAVIINAKHECLYTMGPIDRYLHVASGHPSHDLLAMAPQILRTKLRSAIQQARETKARAFVGGGRTKVNGGDLSFGSDVTPETGAGDELLLVCFVDAPRSERRPLRLVGSGDELELAELEQELVATRAELQGAIRCLELSTEEQKAINEEALSANEEYQSANEELLTSKEELQSLNEELTALNGQLQETLERQRTTSDDLQNVLYSTDVATIFLDTDFHIRFFTPATKLLFSIIQSDIGRPLADLSSLAADSALLADAQTVLDTLAPIEREIETQSGVWFIRRILPYRTHDQRAEGVVITFTDTTERKRASKALEAAKLQAEIANVAKSRFLAAASHDLRQPLQTLALLQGLLKKIVKGERAEKLVARLEETVGVMSGMLNTLLDINQIEAGTVNPEKVSFPINDILTRLRDELSYHAQSQGLTLRVVPCAATVYSDPALLEQMIRNLLSNALKYTERGKVLLGCRRRNGGLSIEIWDTGIGIPEAELHTIFEEYHQLDNAARERSRGLGLGLSIVKRLGALLGHHVRVSSRPGKGSVFSVDVMPPAAGTPEVEHRPSEKTDAAAEGGQRKGTILIVEDDPELRELLEILLTDGGHKTVSAPDGVAALDLVNRGVIRPDLILTDYNLPDGLNGLELTAKLRQALRRETPVIILTGDISTGTLRDIALESCVQLTKPVKPEELTQVIERLVPLSPPSSAETRPPPQSKPAASGGPPVIFVVDDDTQVRQAIRTVLEDDARIVEDFPTCEAFLEAYRPGREACLLIDAYLPGMSGLDLLQRLRETGDRLPAIMITGSSDVPMAVQAMKAGALDFIEKPIGHDNLLESVGRALEQSRDSNTMRTWRATAASHIAGLTQRQRQIMDLVLAGHPSKNIAADLGISQRTVENHRASIMKRTGAKSLPALARLALAAQSMAGEGLNA